MKYLVGIALAFPFDLLGLWLLKSYVFGSWGTSMWFIVAVTAMEIGSGIVKGFMEL